MQEVTRHHFAEGTWIHNLRAHLAVRAILRAIDRYRRPTSYLIDLATDANQLYKHAPARFVYILRENGTHLHFPNTDACQDGRLLALEQFDATVRVFGKDCQCFTYDEDRLSGHNVEPELELATVEEARLFLQELVDTYPQDGGAPAPRS